MKPVPRVPLPVVVPCVAVQLFNPTAINPTNPTATRRDFMRIRSSIAGFMVFKDFDWILPSLMP
jgi:hypothetical protein